MIFRRKAAAEQPDPADAEALDGRETDELGDRPRGPWDSDERTADNTSGYVDLGGMLVKPAAGLELRLQIDEQAQTVSAVMLAGADSGLELRAFAAPRSSGIWDDVRTDIAAEATKRGGTATERDGEFGIELLVAVPVQTPDGRQGTQTSRIVGVDGPRWLLRGTFLGKSASNPDPEGAIETAFRDVVVVRGTGPMAPRDMIAMKMPADVQAGPPDDSGAADDE